MKLTREQVLEQLDQAIVYIEDDTPGTGACSLRQARATVSELYEEVERLRRAVERKNAVLKTAVPQKRDFVNGSAQLAAAIEYAIAYTGEQP